MIATVTARAVALCMMALVGFALDAQAQEKTLLARVTQERAHPGGLKLVLPELERASVARRGPITTALHAPVQQPASPPRCRRGRRAVFGALIGAGAAAPLAALAHTRWENEAANGAAAATTTVLLGAAAGAFIGLATCG